MKIKQLLKLVQPSTYINIISINRECARNYDLKTLILDDDLQKNIIDKYGNEKILRILTDSYVIQFPSCERETISHLDIIID